MKRLTSSPASAGSVSGSKAPDTSERSDSAKLNPSPEKSSAITGPESPSGTMSESSQPSLWEDCNPTLFVEDSPARTSVSPAKGLASKVPGLAFGASSPGLWSSLDPVGSSLRTSVLSALEGLTESALTWRLKDTPSGRLWWVLGRSGPRTEGTGSGSSPDVEWKTPRVEEHSQGPAQVAKYIKAGFRQRDDSRADKALDIQLSTQVEALRRSPACHYSRGRGNLEEEVGAIEHQKNWPTARAEDKEACGAHVSRGTAETLTAAARKEWPTATEGDHKASGTRKSGTTLTDAANGLWARPQAGDWRSLGEATPGHSPQLRHSGGLPAPESPSTSGKSRDWPTAASQTQQGGVRLEGGAAGRRMLKGTELEPGTYRGVLNSRWVAQLMGYPSDWLDVGTGRLSKLWATVSSRKSSRSSDKQ